MIRMTLPQFNEARELSASFCIFCQEQYDGDDLYAHRMPCPGCNRNGVCGLEDLIVSRLIEIIPDDSKPYPTRTDELIDKLREEWRKKPR